jgi:hypothetical protein
MATNEESGSKDIKCLIFLSWQSDRKDCRKYVDSLIKQLPKNLSNLVTGMIDRDTANVPGAPDIGDAIFEKIDKCDLFIADVTLINDNNSGFRLTPNPNVLIELGYAISALGWDRIVLLQCKDYGDIEDLPFDINHRRVSSFSIGRNLPEDERADIIKQSTKRLNSNIVSSIKLLLEKNQLFGGMKGKIPKLELVWYYNGLYMEGLCFTLTNVSSVLISGLKSLSLMVRFSDGKTRVIECEPVFKSTSLLPGGETDVYLYNPILGFDLGLDVLELDGDEKYNPWSNFDLEWLLSCEDESGIVFHYEMIQHIDSSANNIDGIWPLKYCGY